MHNLLPDQPGDDEKLIWLASQADFITFVEIFALMASDLDDTDMTQVFHSDDFIQKVDIMGEMFLTLIDIDISPYSNFHAMRLVVPHTPDIIIRLMDHINKEAAFDDVIKDTGVEPSPESQMEHMLSVISSYDMLRKMSAYMPMSPETEERYLSLGLDELLGPLNKPAPKPRKPEN